MSTKIRKASPQPTSTKAPGRGLDEFKSTFDKSFIIPNKIRAALTKLGNGWEYDANFAKLAELSIADLSAYRSQFAEFQVELKQGNERGKRVWAGTKATAERMRAMVQT